MGEFGLISRVVGRLGSSPAVLVGPGDDAALGDLAGRTPVTRAGARPGDVVVVAGWLGWAAAGLALLHSGEVEGELVDAHRRPQPPYRLGPELAALGATAMCDVSDGLLADVGHLARASDVVIGLHSGRLADDRVDLRDVLTGGDHHALVATLPPGTPLPEGSRAVGRVEPGRAGVLVDGEPASGGWEHFA